MLSKENPKLEIESNKWFLNITLPPLRLITVGAVHVANHLQKLQLFLVTK